MSLSLLLHKFLRLTWMVCEIEVAVQMLFCLVLLPGLVQNSTQLPSVVLI